MRARDQTRTMLRWWSAQDIDRADLAVRRHSGGMIWHHAVDLAVLPLDWLRAENARRADVYIRPARAEAWPLVFLDDVDLRKAKAIAKKYVALVVHTSPAGGCHVWLACDRNLLEAARAQAQRWLACRVGADTASVSGEHLGRLAGFRNWKPDGTWVNVVRTEVGSGRWDPSVALHGQKSVVKDGSVHSTRFSACFPESRDTSQSGREWACACSRLEAGAPPESVVGQLVELARARRGADAERYARRTVDQALRRNR